MLFTFELSMLDGSDNYKPLEHITHINECSGKQSCRVPEADRASILALCLALTDLVNVTASDWLPFADVHFFSSYTLKSHYSI